MAATSFQGSHENNMPRHSDVTTTPIVINHRSQVLDSSVNNHTKYTDQINESTKCMPVHIDDDDDILEVM